MMKFKALKRLALFSSLALVFGQVACEKKRGLRYTQGSGDNVFEIKQYDGNVFKLKTGAKRFKGQTSRADELLTINGFDKINNLDTVDFKISDGLFADIDISDFNFYGRENFEYSFKYTFTDHHVILSKIAAKNDIPSQELTYATDLGNGQFEVPLMGLPISLYTVEKVKDERGKETRTLATFPKDYLNESTHFKIDAGVLKYFEAPSKPDLFSADFFNTTDEWFFTKTLVGRAINSQEILGATEASLKIRFAKTNNSLIGIDLNIAKEQEILDPTKTITALEIPVQWVDFKTDTAGPSARLKETKLGDSESESRFWKERSYALVDFNNADRLDKAFTLDNKLEKLEIGDDYISFTIYESGSGNTYKYSLAKSNRKVEGQNLFADDAKSFHIFTERRKVIRGALQSQEPDIERLVYANRFYPENGEIVYHLSKNSPTDAVFTEATSAAIKAWDDAFQKAGTGMRVRLADERVELGDVRYNTIVLYGYEIDAGSLLGFGPSVQDTRTGETFSAATHIYLRSYREGLISSIRSYIRNELGLYDDKRVEQVPSFAESDRLIEGGGLISNPTPNLGSASSLKEFIANSEMFKRIPGGESYQNRVFGSGFFLDILDDFQKDAKIDTVASQAKMFTENGPACEYASVASVSNSWKQIRNVCASGDTKFAAYVNSLKALHANDSKILNTDGEEEAILECAQPLMKDILVSTLIHEVGHNLGLGHNFAGSSDSEENFARNDDGSIAYPSSSVMDYPDADFNIRNKPGPYDIAAVRFLYSRKVETQDGQVIDVPKTQSIATAAGSAGKDVKGFRMCTDMEVGRTTNLPYYDPMCSKWDEGSTPEAYVKWAIGQIHSDIILNGFRYNNKGFRGAIGSLTYLDHFKQIQEYFRFLVRGQAGVFLEKLKGDTPAAKKASLEAVIAATPERDRPQVQSYYNAVKEIYKFGREVMALPTRVCIIKNAAGAVVDALEFAPLRQRIYDKEQVTVQTCKQASLHASSALTEMKKAYAADAATLTFLDRGTELKGLELSLNPAAAADKLKQLSFVRTESIAADLDPRFSSGTLALKNKAIQMLTSRESMLDLAYEAGVGETNFLDYEWFAEELYNDAWSNILVGVKGELSDPTLLAGKVLQHYEDFADLTPYYLFTLFINGLDTRSDSFTFARTMQPNKERSLSLFASGLGASERPIWHMTNTDNEVLYAERGVAKEMIKLFVQIQQIVPSYFTFQDTHDPEKTGGTMTTLQASLASQDASLALDDRLFQAASSFIQEKGIALQPAQKALLRQYIATAKAAPAAPVDASADVNTANATVVFNAVKEFSDKELLNQRLLSLAADESNNLSALESILNSIFSSF
ncbi:MAG TPA: zinc-dependent metalloprotease [Oligoflexus sp.]|uniref:zinc-dependent metalloprotease n=1 Tax=Oligoflexus sp. TaxID=1971216 RepID=UPI002D5B81B7|nr:zinc-dependent metalloprotease [Oligoflexus sp.]HYX32015.1 zinc-dependent metalloprotease [Oligoflexus sp.]